MVTELPGKARHPLQQNRGLHVFPNWQRPSQGSENLLIEGNPGAMLSPLDSWVKSSVLTPTDSFRATPAPWSHGSRGRGGIRVTASSRLELVAPGLSRSLFSLLPPSLLLATHTASGEELGAGRTETNMPRTTLVGCLLGSPLVFLPLQGGAGTRVSGCPQGSGRGNPGTG